MIADVVAGKDFLDGNFLLHVESVKSFFESRERQVVVKMIFRIIENLETMMSIVINIQISTNDSPIPQTCLR